jgi:lipoprotein-releasing system permease protein
MPYEIFIGLRYLKAKRKQTFISVISFISVLGITVGVTALIVVLSVMNGFEENVKEKILGINANIVVTGFARGISGYEDVASEVRRVGGVVGATPFTYNQAMISSESGVTGAVIRGLDMKSAAEATVLPARMKEGSIEGIALPLGEADGGRAGLPGIVIGSELARNIGASTGSVVSVISPLGAATPAGPVPRVAAFRVAGVFEIGLYEYDSSLAFMSLANSQRFFRMGETVTGVEVRVADIYRADETADGIVEALGGAYVARTWMEMNRNLFSALRLEKTAMFIILTLIIMVAALNIISTLIMVVMEKGRDIAILKSLGATSGGVMRIFMIEGLVIGAAGTLFGTAIGLAAALNMERVVEFVEGAFGFKLLPRGIYYIDKFPSKVEPSAVAAIVLISISISFLATLYPSWRASRLDPVEGLRYE